ncbi:MAG: tRNA 2-thiouridine(34) synthase MnmA [Flavobacteriales bacterium]|nr:tRNA 2-thiouridine(34) synthase MnmA [Flavobacteriales bacterium]
MSKHGKILVAMSGGVDSSVVAMMLHDQGYEVIGITMKTWDYESVGGSKKETGCCSLDSINDARQMAVEKGFHHMIIDLRDEFGDYIINNFVEEYLAGRTPNPCVLCNTHIKWEALLRRANQLDCEFIATGHYASIREENERYIVSMGKDQTKDQSYVLWGVSQENLARTKLPLGEYLKSDIKQMALDSGYKELANKSESYEICFIPDNDYRGLLKRKNPGLEERLNGGNFISTKGEILGKHRGFPFYTIGQRKGLEVAFGEPVYVTNINAETNTVTLGSRLDLERKSVYVRDMNWIKREGISGEMDVLAKIRYKDSGTMCTIEQEGDLIKGIFHESASAIAPGQSAVFYEGSDVLGGGIIC